MGKESACNAGDLGSMAGWGSSSGEGDGKPLQYCLENPMDRGARRAGYSPQGCKESDTTEQLIQTKQTHNHNATGWQEIQKYLHDSIQSNIMLAFHNLQQRISFKLLEHTENSNKKGWKDSIN